MLFIMSNSEGKAKSRLQKEKELDFFSAKVQNCHSLDWNGSSCHPWIRASSQSLCWQGKAEVTSLCPCPPGSSACPSITAVFLVRWPKKCWGVEFWNFEGSAAPVGGGLRGYLSRAGRVCKGPRSDRIRSEDQTQLNSAGGGQALKIFQLQPYTTSLSHRLEEKPQTFNTDPWNVTFKMDLRWFLMFFLQENFTPWTSSLPCPVRGKSAPETGAQEGKVLYFIHPENRRNWFGEFSPVLSSIGWVGGILMHSCFLLLGLWSCCGHTFLGFCCSHWVCRSLTWGTGKCQAWWKFFILLLRSFLQVPQCA